MQVTRIVPITLQPDDVLPSFSPSSNPVQVRGQPKVHVEIIAYAGRLQPHRPNLTADTTDCLAKLAAISDDR